MRSPDLVGATLNWRGSMRKVSGKWSQRMRAPVSEIAAASAISGIRARRDNHDDTHSLADDENQAQNRTGKLAIDRVAAVDAL